MGIRLTIDGRPVEVEPGQTVLAAAQALGIEIPTLCYLERCGPLTTCLVCLVKVRSGEQGRLVPACGLQAQHGMVVESETDEVHEARRTALELLFSDHVGDCLSPCSRICPLQLNIPALLRQIQSHRLDQAIVTLRHALPLPAILGRLCHRPCENGCRRATADDPAAIRDLEQYTADQDASSPAPYAPARKTASGKQVAIVGTGPTGLAACDFLMREGHSVLLLDRHDSPGGSLRREVQTSALPPDVLARECRQLEARGARWRLQTNLGTDVSLENLQQEFDAILLAIGPSAKSQADQLALPATAAGLNADPDTCRTQLSRVFASGSAVKPVRQLVRALLEGKLAAAAIHQFLLGSTIRRPTKPFSSTMGRLDPAELRLFRMGPNPSRRIAPESGILHGFRPREAALEASRCLHCDCRAVGHCRLQTYAERYGVDASRFRSQRRLFDQHLQHGEIIFEPGKCILCGLCVKIAEQAREPLGLAFIGRGFNVRVATPFNRSIADGLQKIGHECVKACPTGALVFKDTLQDRFSAHLPQPDTRSSSQP